MDHPDENHMLLDKMESIQQIKFSSLENSMNNSSQNKRRAAKSSEFFFVAYQSTCISIFNLKQNKSLTIIEIEEA